MSSRFKGYETYLVQELVLSVCAIRYRRERWVTPDGQTLVAPLPEGTQGHFGPNLRRFVLMQYHHAVHIAAADEAVAVSWRVDLQARDPAAIDREAGWLS